MRKLKLVFYTAAFLFAAYCSTFEVPKDNQYYKENGILVYATITEVKHSIRGRESYICEYTNIEGKTVTAQLLYNRLHGEFGQIVEGYYLPEEPKKVYCLMNTPFYYVAVTIIDITALCYTITTLVTFLQKEE